VQITASNASGTAPHADSRSLTFDPSGNLVETDDGGIYRLSGPRTNSGTWSAALGNISNSEFIGFAYDSLNDAIIAGAQDNGTALQSGFGSSTWRAISGGDGGFSAVDNNQAAHPGQSVLYSTAQFLGSFQRQVRDASNNLIGDPVSLALRVTGPGITGTSTLKKADTVQFYSPYVVNSAAGDRLLIGTGDQNNPGTTGYIYESKNRGDDLVRLTAAPVGFVTALAYGGVLGGAANPDVAYVGTQGDNPLLLRTAAGGAFNPVPAYATAGGSAPRSIALDPDNWKRAYIVDANNRVWLTTNAGTSFTQITGNVGALSGSLRTVAVYDQPNAADEANDDTVFLGGLGGVFVAGNPQTSSSAWSQFGTVAGARLPNVVVNNLIYDTTDNLLLAGTLGRGGWTVANLSAFTNPPATANQAPTVAAPANATASGDPFAPLIFSTQNKNAITVADLDAGTNSQKVQLTVTKGSLRLATTTGLDLQLGGSNGPSLTFAGPLSAINAALNGLVFTAPSNANDTTKLTIVVDDQGGTGSGGSKVTVVEVPIAITKVNDTPANAVPAAQLVKTGGTLAFSTATGNAVAVSDGDSGTNALQVTLAVDGGTFTLNSTTNLSLAAGASATNVASIVFTGSLPDINAALQTLVYTPAAAPTGPATLTITTSDQGGTSPDGTLTDPKQSSASVSITATAANIAPVVILPAPISTPLNTAVTLTAANNITLFDIDGGKEALTIGVSGGSVTVNGGSNVIPDGYTSTYSAYSVATLSGVLDGLVFTPTPGFAGPAGVTIKLNDLGNTGPNNATTTPLSTTATLRINVASPPPPTQTAPIKAEVAPGARETFSSAQGDAISVSNNDSMSTQLEVALSVDNGVLSLDTTDGLDFLVGTGIDDNYIDFVGTPEAIDAALNGLSYTPDPGFQGVDTLTITTSDPQAVGDRLPPPPNNIIDSDNPAIGGTSPTAPPTQDPNGVNLLDAKSTGFQDPLPSVTTTISIVVDTSPVDVRAGGPYTVAEGGSLTLAAVATSRDGNPLTYSFDVNGDGVFGDVTGQDPTLTWAQLNALGITHAGTYHVSVQASDGVSDPVTSPATTLTITAVAPTLSGLSITPAVVVNGTATLTGFVTDPAYPENFSLNINWGDGSAPQTVTLPFTNATTAQPFRVNHQYLGNHPTGSPVNVETVQATLSDGRGNTVVASTATLLVHIPPTLSNVAATPASIDGTTTLSGTITEPDPLDTYTLQVAWGDGTLTTTNLPAGSKGFQVNHTYAVATTKSSASYIIGTFLSDAWGGSATVNTSTTVPMAQTPTPTPTPTPTLATILVGAGLGVPAEPLNFAAAVVGSLAPGVTLVEWDFGDGVRTPLTFVTSPAVISMIHHYNLPGFYTVRFTAFNANGALSTSVLAVAVTPTEVVPNPSGGTTLLIGGTPGNDVFRIRRLHNGGVLAGLNGHPFGPYRGLRNVISFGGGGRDHIKFAGHPRIPVTLVEPQTAALSPGHHTSTKKPTHPHRGRRAGRLG